MKKIFFAAVFMVFPFFCGAQSHCLVQGTKVFLANNTLKNIEDIKPGDKVLSYNTLTGEQFSATVEKVICIKHKNLVTYTFDGGKTITATDDHPFFTQRGWASLNPSKTASYKGFERVVKVESGDGFKTKNGSVRLSSTSLSCKVKTTYSITKLSEGNSYYANGILTGVEEL